MTDGTGYRARPGLPRSTVTGTVRQWGVRHWTVAVGATALIALVVAIPTAVLPNPWFDREVAVTWWSYPTLALSAVLGGLLAATYVGVPRVEQPRPARRAWIGGALSWFAVGCPVCNKLVLLALGYSGAITWFAPVQPLLAVGSVGLLGWALGSRLRAERSCSVLVRRTETQGERQS